MSGKSPIQWTEATWNPVVGCKRVSAGCDHCYAFQLHDQRHIAWKRGRFPTAPKQYHVPFSQVQLMPERLSDPLHWRKPRVIFVNSMSDLFHEAVPDSFIEQVWETMRQTPRHTYQILTKRPERMAALCDRINSDPLPNVWLGTSVENQAAANERIPYLAQTPAAVRFLSCEPLLERIDINDWLGQEAVEPYEPWEPYSYERFADPLIDWVIVGGESGPHARRFCPEWSLIEECRAAGVPLFVKQFGTVWAKEHHAHDHHGGDMSEWPEYYRVRQYPQARSVAA